MNITAHFSFEGKAITTQTDENGLDWCSANDVAAALGYANPSKSVRDHVDDDDLTKREAIDNLGRNQVANFVNESGLYSLILRSNKPEAKRCKRWVTTEGLPSIRQKGGYIAENATPDQILTLKKEKLELVQALGKQRIENEALDAEVRQRCAENSKLSLALEEIPTNPIFDDCGGYPNECVFSSKFMSTLRQVGTEKAQRYFMKLGKTLDKTHAEVCRLKHRYNELNIKYQKLADSQ